MQVLPTRVDRPLGRLRREPRRDARAARRARRLLAQSRAGGSERSVCQRHRDRGRLLPRERIELLVDPDTPAAGAVAADRATAPSTTSAAAGSPALGVVSGVECVIGASDPTVKGGATNPLSLRRSLRAMEIARTNRLPMVNLTESAGADLPKQAEIFVPGGQSFRNLTQLSAAGIPTITLVFGPSTAGGAYIPGMSDYSVLVKRAGARLPRRPAAGEDGDRRGGRRGVARRRGDARHRVRRRRLPRRGRARRAAHRPRHRRAPQLAQARARAVAAGRTSRCTTPTSCSASARWTSGCRSTSARSSRASSTAAASRSSSRATARRWSAAGRRSTASRSGSSATTGSCSARSRRRARSSSSCATSSDIPLVFLQNITGFMVGTAYEQGGIIKDGAKLINAVSNSTVPHLTIMIGASLRRRELRHVRAARTTRGSCSPGPTTASR